jgi:cytochrome c biogenesis factor
MLLSHLGFLIAVANILIFHLFKIEYHINMIPLEKIKINNIEIIFRGYELIKKQIYTSNYGNFLIKWEDFTWGIFPEQSFSFFSNALITKSSILTNGLVDCYITVLEDSFNGLVHITFNYMTSFI